MLSKKLLCLALLLPTLIQAEPASQQRIDELAFQKQRLETEQKAIEQALLLSEKRLQELEQMLKARRQANVELDRKITKAAQLSEHQNTIRTRHPSSVEN
ncbi:hypothetical protein [Solemya velesiana gill symbiont]|uniref:YbgF trimerisation domain-containing protein n=1 Tax=Solemya velesiana gill symbiont TaxID=1918948 RepID=A0A1T2KS80_9GAMM|nr:hypothetical protein [Solemya velesiana gill symbiont]OOZ35651.1 hypothetical protein BOW51_10985 [Solemya velesiana gill symbiont]